MSASSSRNPDNGSAYTVAFATNARTRARSSRAKPPRITSGLFIDQRLVELDVDVPRAVNAEQIHLLDRLRRAGTAEARGTIGRDHEQRQSRVMRLDQRGQ